MELQALQIFVEVVRRGSFAAVARDRGVDPSTVSRAVATLEQQLSLRLLQRSTRRLALTEAGRVYYDRVEPLMDELEQAGQEAADLGAGPRGILRIAAPVSFSQLNLVPLLPELARAHPELGFELLLTDARLDLLAERIDVAVQLGALEDSSLIAIRLGHMVARVCASPEYLRRRGHPRTPQELAEHDCLLLDMPGFSDVWRFRSRDGDVAEVQVTGRLRTSNAIALKQCALDGMGIILQGRWIVGRELRDGSLVDLFPECDTTASTAASADAWLVYPSRSYLPLKVRVFIDFLRRKFQETPPWDAPATP